jgi:predicted outer membrane repeat protein
MYGSALYINTEDRVQIIIDNSTFIENNASSEGGAIYCEFYSFSGINGDLNITNSFFIDNLAAMNGGGIIVKYK